MSRLQSAPPPFGQQPQQMHATTHEVCATAAAHFFVNVQDRGPGAEETRKSERTMSAGMPMSTTKDKQLPVHGFSNFRVSSAGGRAGGGAGGGGGDAQQSLSSQMPSAHTTSPRFSLSDMPSGQLSESRKHVMKQQSAATHVFLQQRALADGRNAHWGG